jgi:uncharacterized protein (TIGR03067 family)
MASWRVVLASVGCLALGAGLRLSAASPAEDALKKEWARLEGTWEYVRPEGSKDTPLRLEFKDRKLTVTWVGMASLPAEVKLYPDTDLRCIDIEFKKVRRESYEGIYKIEGDTLRLALAPADVKARPTKIPAKAEPGKEHQFGAFTGLREADAPDG